MKDYKSRIADRMLHQKLESSGAVLIQGPKWCGKTTTAEQLAASKLYMNDPDEQMENLRMASMATRRLLVGKVPRLIDEWQLAPQLWDAIRFEVDHREEHFGQFILTGSAVPPDKSAMKHSGTGRFSWLTMRTMSLWESGDSTGEVSLTELFNGGEADAGEKKMEIERIAYLICRGGWPGALGMTESAALRLAFNYVDAVAESDMSRVDGISRDREYVIRLLRSYARHQGSQVSVKSLNDDMAANEGDMSASTINSYQQALRMIFVIEDMPAWNPNLRSKTAIRTSDTRYFTDSSIATAALGLGPNDLLNDLKTMGLLFETMAVRDLRVYADALDGRVYHYRDKNGLECDAVIHLRNGKYGLVEIKLGGEKLIDEGAANLSKLEKKIDTERMNAPAFKMVLVGVGKYAYRREDGVLVVPIGCLKD
ncbi:MAG: hypothetical protein AUK63_405 [bacterium P3]|nr:MAG: hypothetical protein AUK63_405 [bacterium P3]KWW42635.1 MAG: hypothetical protein F083_39 [bacterium F083]